MVAGLGIAGIAVSLAAQDSLKNLFGSITILLDRPFKIGDRISAPDTRAPSRTSDSVRPRSAPRPAIW